MLALRAVCSSCNANEGRLTASILCASPWMLPGETFCSKARTSHTSRCDGGQAGCIDGMPCHWCLGPCQLWQLPSSMAWRAAVVSSAVPSLPLQMGCRRGGATPAGRPRQHLASRLAQGLAWQSWHKVSQAGSPGQRHLQVCTAACQPVSLRLSVHCALPSSGRPGSQSMSTLTAAGRKISDVPEVGGDPGQQHMRKIAVHVSAYITHVRTQLKQTIPKAIVHCLVSLAAVLQAPGAVAISPYICPSSCGGAACALRGGLCRACCLALRELLALPECQGHPPPIPHSCPAGKLTAVGVLRQKIRLLLVSPRASHACLVVLCPA